MTKQEKIQESYGEYFDLCAPEMNNGWSVKRKGIGFEKLKKQIELQYNQSHNAYAFRPKLLQGIENNNGWIKIENEKDLPKEDCDCMLYFSDSEIRCDRFLFNHKNFRTTHYRYVTHYKPIKKPQPPIY